MRLLLLMNSSWFKEGWKYIGCYDDLLQYVSYVFVSSDTPCISLLHIALVCMLVPFFPLAFTFCADARVFVCVLLFSYWLPVYYDTTITLGVPVALHRDARVEFFAQVARHLL